MTKTSLLRRFLPFALAAGLVLSACGTTNPIASASEAFRLNGKAYSIDDLDALNDALIAAGQYQTQNGTISQQDAATTLAVMIRYYAYKDFIEANGLTETQADIDAVRTQTDSDPDFAGYPEALRTALFDLNVSDQVMTRVSAPSQDQLRGLYESRPATSGVLCLSHVLVETEDEALEVLEALRDGADFADVAAERSIEPNADQSGGALKDGDEDCSPLPSLQQSFDADFMAGAIAAKAGVPSPPVQSQFGWHIILNHPFDEIAESAARVVGANPGALLLAGHLAAADVSVNSKYGTWNPATGRID